MSKQLLFSVFLLIAANAHAGLPAKMLTESKKLGATRLFDDASRNGIKKGTSRVNQRVVRCQPSKPAQVPLSSGTGSGTIVIVDGEAGNITSISVDGGEANLYPESAQRNGFRAITDGAEDGTTAVAFRYSVTAADGGTAIVTCEESVVLIFVVKDEFDVTMDYEINTEERAGGGAMSRVAVLNAKSGTRLVAESMKTNGGTDANGRRHLKTSDEVKLHEATDNIVAFDSDGSMKDVVLVQVETKSSDNRTIRRTIVSPTVAATPAVESIELESTEINCDGDVELQFSCGLELEDPVLLKAVVQIECDGETVPDELLLRVMTTDFKFVLNGGWIRKVAEEVEAQEGCDIRISEAVALDPDDGYVMVGHMSVPVDVQIEQRRHLLAQKPTEEELSISIEMKEGRSPRDLPASLSGSVISPNFDSPETDGIFEVRAEGNNRKLEPVVKPNGYRGARILTHGYCSIGVQPFPTNKFKFSLPFDGNFDNNWSNNRFAMEILQFSEDNNLDGCSIIAHSQGGLGSLTMKTFYHSCLDSPRFAIKGLALEDSSLIQTVGSPYKGTPLQNSLTALGVIFGVGCGFQEDLTPNGAKKWLREIPFDQRANVWYYRTADRKACSSTDSSCTFSFCQLASDPLLSEPEDGVVEVKRGKLKGGNNQGVKYEQCHSSDMRFPDQTKNKKRNKQMNNQAPV